MRRFAFTSQDYLRDPASTLTRLRAAGLIVEVRFPIVGRTWITTDSEMASRVLKDSETFTMRRNGSLAGLRWWMPGWIRTLAVSMLSMDEPDHTRLRGIVDEAFRRYCQLGAEEAKLPRAQPSREDTSAQEGNTSRIAPGEEGAITSSSVLTGREAMTAELEVIVDRSVSGEELLRMPG